MYVPVQFHRTNDWFCSAAGCLFNGALLWLVAKRTEPEMLPYRPILQLSTSINLLYLAVIAVVVPVMPTDRGYHAFVSVGPLGWLPQPFNFALVFSWFFLFDFTLYSQSIPFIYRYALICRNKSHYGLRHYLAMLACPFLITAVQIVNHIFIGYASGEPAEQQRIREFFFNETVEAGQPHFVVAHFTDEARTFPLVVYGGSWALVSYALVVMFGWLIYRHLRRRSAAGNLSADRVREINRQVSRTLVCMALVPLLAGTAPGLWMVAMALAGLPVGNISAYSTAMFAWAPMIDPLITTWVVHSYRREVGKWLRWVVCGKQAATTTTHVTALKPASKLTAAATTQQPPIKNPTSQNTVGNIA